MPTPNYRSTGLAEDDIGRDETPTLDERMPAAWLTCDDETQRGTAAEQERNDDH